MQDHAESLGCHGLEWQCTVLISSNANVLIRTYGPHCILQTHSVHLSILTGPRTFIFSGKLAKADFYVNTKSTKKAAAVHDVK